MHIDLRKKWFDIECGSRADFRQTRDTAAMEGRLVGRRGRHGRHLYFVFCRIRRHRITHQCQQDVCLQGGRGLPDLEAY